MRAKAGILFALAVAAGCGRRTGPPDARAARPDVPVATVDTATLDVPLALPAQLYVEHDALVYARTTGIVESIYVDLGTPVREGQLLAQLESADQAIAAEQADEAYVRAEREVDRQRELAKTRAISAADSENAEFAFHRAALAVRQARRNYLLTQIVAPFAGLVTARAVRPHRLVAAGDSLFRVSALGPLRVSVHVPEGHTAGLVVGAAAEVAVAGGGVARAAVIQASPTVDAASGTRELILQVTPGSGLRPGMAVTVRVGAERRRVVAIPRDAIAEQGYVLVWESGRTVLRSVTLGAELGDGRLEVVSGLAPGEQVVRSPPP